MGHEKGQNDNKQMKKKPHTDNEKCPEKMTSWSFLYAKKTPKSCCHYQGLAPSVQPISQLVKENFFFQFESTLIKPKEKNVVSLWN